MWTHPDVDLQSHPVADSSMHGTYCADTQDQLCCTIINLLECINNQSNSAVNT